MGGWTLGIYYVVDILIQVMFMFFVDLGGLGAFPLDLGQTYTQFPTVNAPRTLILYGDTSHAEIDLKINRNKNIQNRPQK